jgi:hypothetical protein
MPLPPESRLIPAESAPGTVISCSLTDVMMADITVSVVFFFERALDTGHLADSLAGALGAVPAFAGRLRPSGNGAGLELVCDGSGAAWSSGDARETLAEAVSRVTLPSSGYVEHADARGARSGGRPLLTVRASALADGGMALGCSWDHAVGDLGSFLLLMRAWSARARGAEPPEVVTVADRDAYLDAALPPADSGRPGIRLLGEDEAAGRQRDLEAAIMSARTVQIYFTEAEARAAQAELSTAAGRRLSVTDVLCAHVVTVIRDLDADPEARSLALTVDLRPRLGLAAGAVGNLTNEIYLPGAAPDAARLAGQIRAAIEDFSQSHLSIRSSHAYLESVGGRGRLADCVPVGFDLRHKTFSFNSWRRFGLYDLEFDGQRPVLFSPSASVTVPWTSWLVEGFGGEGYLFTAGVPGRLAARLRGADGRAALHRYRAGAGELPALVAGARKIL